MLAQLQIFQKCILKPADNLHTCMYLHTNLHIRLCIPSERMYVLADLYPALKP